MNLSTKPIVQINASSLKHSPCLRKYYLTVVEGYRHTSTTDSIEFGTAFHRFAQAFILSGGDKAVAMQTSHKYWFDIEASGRMIRAKGENLNIHYLTTVCLAWCEAEGSRLLNSGKLILDPTNNNTPLVELQFRIPFLSLDNADFVLAGTIDLPTRLADGVMCIEDYKTTGTWNVEEKLAEYGTSSQLLFYTNAIKLLAAMGGENNMWAQFHEVNARINGVFLRATKNQVEFQSSSIIKFTDLQYRTMNDMLSRLCHDLDASIGFNQLPPPQGIVNAFCVQGNYGAKGLCPFAGGCKWDDEERQRLSWEAARLVRIPYNPLDYSIPY